MDTSLVIMAAGIGSRFGGGIKQLHPVGENGELIIDYSIHDAIQAGFSRIIFVIRREIESEFNEAIGDRIREVCRRMNVGMEVVFQDMEDVPDGVEVPAGRKKPWGTGHAVLSARSVISGPFLVINADDFYGREAFVRGNAFLQRYDPERPTDIGMVSFVLKNTLSEHGSVTRGVCSTDETGHLRSITETHELHRTDGTAHGWYEKRDGSRAEWDVALDSPVSMNLWGLTPEFIDILEDRFIDFFDEIKRNGTELTQEFLLPITIGRLLEEGAVTVDVLHTEDKWFGVTFKEDVETAREAVRKLTESGAYSADLFSDL
jgi:hypothetical protein